MWRLGMSLENSTVHVGEKVQLAGGVIKADVQGLWRGNNGPHRHSSGIVTSKTKTIYRSKSAQFYIFIQLCQETWEFDEDGERYSEKIVHGKCILLDTMNATDQQASCRNSLRNGPKSRHLTWSPSFYSPGYTIRTKKWNICVNTISPIRSLKTTRANGARTSTRSLSILSARPIGADHWAKSKSTWRGVKRRSCWNTT